MAFDRRPDFRRDSTRTHSEREESISLDVSAIQLKPQPTEGLPPALFDEVANQVAIVIGQDKNYNKNRPTQIRQFYDEVVMWEEKIRHQPNGERRQAYFAECLPFIRMLNAKVAYAEGRDHVDKNFVRFINHCLSQVDSYETLRNFKFFFEAFLGFYKAVRPKN